MAGISDLPFRSLALRCGAESVVSEMVPSGDMLRARPDARARAELGIDEARTAIQLAGRDPELMAEAARFCADQGAARIDINFGCPAKKVTGGLSGSALMREPDHAIRIVAAVAEAVTVPVSVKMRLGWDEARMNAPEIAMRSEAAGATRIAVHGRTRCQFYAGHADWRAIAAVKAAVRVPVIANGDIADPASAQIALRLSRADGVMVGRGTRGRPWILGEIAARLAGIQPPPAPVGKDLFDLIAGHYEAMLDFYGRDLGRRVARKHLGWYLDAIPGSSNVRREVLTSDDPALVLRLLRSALAGLGPEEALAAA
jgi:nifR3 family TIM-barrel protein